MNGSYAGSRSVAPLPSKSALRIAVTGGQKLYVYLASKTAISASAPAMAARANRRAFSSPFSCFAAESWRKWH
jgi:hypothetical protein